MSHRQRQKEEVLQGFICITYLYRCGSIYMQFAWTTSYVSSYTVLYTVPQNVPSKPLLLTSLQKLHCRKAFTDSKLWRCLDPNIFDRINSISKTQYTSSYSWIISIVYLISLMIKYRVNSTGLHTSIVSLSFTSVHTLLGFLPYISIIFFHLLLNCFVFLWALLLNHLVLYTSISYLNIV